MIQYTLPFFFFFYIFYLFIYFLFFTGHNFFLINLGDCLFSLVNWISFFFFFCELDIIFNKIFNKTYK